MDSIAILATRLRSSRILPGQGCESRAEIACVEKFLAGAFKRKKCSASATMSSGRSRSGGTRELELAETMKKILAEAAFANRGFQVLIGRGDDTDVYLDFPVPPETIEGLPIQHAQQLYLSVQLQFADFVEEQRPSVGHFKQAWLGSVSPAERTLFITEQFALHQIFREARRS